MWELIMTGASSQNKREEEEEEEEEEVATAKTLPSFMPPCMWRRPSFEVVVVFVSKCMHNFLTTPWIE